MILRQVKFKGLTVYPHQIKNNNCYYFKDGKEIEFQYRLTKLPDFYVSGEALHLNRSSIVDELTSTVILQSLFDFNVSGDTLNIKN